MEQRLGFIQDMMDVKVLILFVMAIVETPVSAQTIYELCYQDDCLSYMDVKQAIPQMEESGHLEKVENDRYVITEKGREAEQLTNDSIAYPVRVRAEAAAENLNNQIRRQQFVHAEYVQEENGECTVKMELNDLRGRIMALELAVPTRLQAKRLADAFMNKAEAVYQGVLIGLLEEQAENLQSE